MQILGEECFRQREQQVHKPQPFYESTIILIPKVKETEKNFTPISFGNIDAEILSQTLANSIRHFLKRMTRHD